jgi:hypothetical protein
MQQAAPTLARAIAKEQSKTTSTPPPLRIAPHSLRPDDLPACPSFSHLCPRLVRHRFPGPSAAYRFAEYEKYLSRDPLHRNRQFYPPLSHNQMAVSACPWALSSTSRQNCSRSTSKGRLDLLGANQLLLSSKGRIPQEPFRLSFFILVASSTANHG